MAGFEASQAGADCHAPPQYFKVPQLFQQRVLKWGLIGAALLRGAFIAAGLIAIEVGPSAPTPRPLAACAAADPAAAAKGLWFRIPFERERER